MTKIKTMRSKVPRITIKFDIQTNKKNYLDYTFRDLRSVITHEFFARPNFTIWLLCVLIILSVITLSLLTELSLDIAIFGSVSCASLFIALMIFKIQSFPVPTYHLSFKSLSESRFLAFLIIENSGVTDFRGEFLEPSSPRTEYLPLSHNISTCANNSPIEFNAPKGHRSVAPIWIFQIEERRSEDITFKGLDIRNSDFKFFIKPKSFMYKRMGGLKEICFSSLQIAPKINEMICNIDDPYFESAPIQAKVGSSQYIYDVDLDSNDFSNATIVD